MNNIKKAAKFVMAKPESEEAKALLALAVALETKGSYEVNMLYEMDHEGFKLAIGMIDDWRLDRHYLSKLHLLDHADVTRGGATKSA